MKVTCGCGAMKEISERCRDQSVAKYGGYKCLSCIVKARGSKNGEGMKRKALQLYGQLNNTKIIVQCSQCLTALEIQYQSLKLWKKRHNREDYVCGNCLNRVQDRSKSKSEDLRSLHSKKSLEQWQDPEYREKVTKATSETWESAELRFAASESSKKAWEDSGYRERVIMGNLLKWADEDYREKMEQIRKDLWEDEGVRQRYREATATPEFRKKMSDAAKQLWEDPETRLSIIESQKKVWKDPEYRQKMSKIFSDNMKANWQNPEYKEMQRQRMADPAVREKMAIAQSKVPRVSSLQKILYGILRDLDVKFFQEYEDKAADPECRIGPWNFDCVIPRAGKPTLLIEVQGEHWHTEESGRGAKDRAKVSYVMTNFPDQYEVKHIWEHEFKCQEKIVELLKYWLGITVLELIDFNFNDVQIKDCPPPDYRDLLSKYHYLPNAGRGGKAFGAYLSDELIAVCVFSPPIRQNVNLKGHTFQEVKELSRLCIHPRYQKHNFASWFISRCLKMLVGVKMVISYCDETFNHNGATYKASNFVLDGEVHPDYWYVSNDGWIMHKKTLWEHAQKASISEREYAESQGFRKVWGQKKLRFIYALEA